MKGLEDINGVECGGDLVQPVRGIKENISIEADKFRVALRDRFF
jgi:hypothetical protein